jgi:hypothetical protein
MARGFQFHIGRYSYRVCKACGIARMDWDAVDRSIDSMNKRIQQVLGKHGGHTKF